MSEKPIILDNKPLVVLELLEEEKFDILRFRKFLVKDCLQGNTDPYIEQWFNGSISAKDFTDLGINTQNKKLAWTYWIISARTLKDMILYAVFARNTISIPINIAKLEEYVNILKKEYEIN